MGAPRLVDHRLQRHAGTVAGFLQHVDDVLDVLCAVARHDQHGIALRNDDHVAQPNHSYRRAVVDADQRVRRIDRHDVADQCVAVVGVCRNLPQGVPRTDIKPAHLHRHDGGAAGMLITA